ncbi:flagellar hook-length control protein FliK [Bradyrhizobium sp. NP1]|uniref:flagellar hook-length control protein FliK n=1 Tax=Bradyrhizobium sp. NP1 TaxID=3049772 RepID=UPI0025A5D7C6|nr:flagellar hook-length control protein FliK [Bradyrhizobium sp. NP1]WJR81144.1 flagellar hook-length control protein FliK [Bradyrhizobium sp. NP1]
MALSVNPTLPVIAATPSGAVSGLALQAGTIVNAEVLNTLAENLVQIAIAGLSLDVLTEVPLQAGQKLQLAVSQTDGGIRLSIVPPNASGVTAPSLDSVTLTPNAPLAAPSASPADALSQNLLSPAERVAVAVATQSAAAQQGSQAPLFADLSALVTSTNLPPALQQAAAQVLAQRTDLDESIGGGDIQQAFAKSGLLLEATLASGSVGPGAGVPDLKAALIVLRQALVALDGAQGATTPQPAAPGLAATAGGAATTAPGVAERAPPLAPSSPETELQEILLPQARLPAAVDSAEASLAVRLLPEALLRAAPRTATAGDLLTLLQEALPDGSHANAAQAAALPNVGREDLLLRTSTPPPPFRGSLPSAQPVAAPSIAPDAPLAATTHHLLTETDAALARQTLLQVASLPDRADPQNAPIDPSAPRWHFEIPFATPQGTALAQFEIARDGGASEVEAAKRIWRARFSLDVEPAGPVHALISLTGTRTSVRMWAERPATAAQLRAGASDLSRALSEAELEPGDIVIRDGTPPQLTPARAGHFLDRAS